jgi:hypothetical protein
MVGVVDPAGHSVPGLTVQPAQEVDPPADHCPATHCTNPDGDPVPGGHWKPAGAAQRPLQAEELLPPRPNVPAGHRLQVAAAPRDHCPGAHGDAVVVGLVDPGAQKYPGGTLQGEQEEAPAPLHCPAPQRPEQTAVASAEVAPYKPAGQSVHDPSPIRLYLPVEQLVTVGEMEPAGQAYPALHGPVQELVLAALVPYRPGSHGPEQAAVVSAEVAPYKPAGQSVHVARPVAFPYVPAGQATAVALVEPAGQ